MTTMTQSRPASIWQHLSDLNAARSERRARYLAYRSTLKQLNALSSRDLTDIGIHPADIERIAEEAAYAN